MIRSCCPAHACGVPGRCRALDADVLSILVAAAGEEQPPHDAVAVLAAALYAEREAHADLRRAIRRLGDSYARGGQWPSVVVDVLDAAHGARHG